MNQYLKTHFGLVYSALSKCRIKYLEWRGKHNQRWVIRYWYRHFYGRNINLDNPKDFDEKINWLKLYSDTSKWSICADKYSVRFYVEKRGLKDALNTLYGIYDKAEDIDFNSLPDSFVIKTTNGGGGKTVLLVKNKQELNQEQVIQTLNKWLKMPVSYLYGEYHYSLIQPRLIIEKYLKPNIGEASLIDYKIDCFDGVPFSILVCSDRDCGHSVKYSVYDLEWNFHPERTIEKYRAERAFPKPKSFNTMIEYSRILSFGFPYVRVDWFEVNEKPVFSELTFTPGAGFNPDYSYEYLLQLGNNITLPITTPGNE